MDRKLQTVFVVLLSLTVVALGACSNGTDSAEATTDTAPPATRMPAPLGKVELPPLEFNTVDESGTVAADITSEALFDKDSAELKPAAQTAIDQIAGRLQAGDAWVRVDGFTDGTGDEAHNIELSKQRADALAERLRALGTAQEVQSCGRGEQGTDGESEDPTARRVVVTISAKPLPGDCS